MICGGCGFAAGFLGPIALDPGANQGPLLGIFITGPASAALGLGLFIVLNIARVGAPHQWKTLWTSSALVTLATLFFCLPGPAYEGYVVDATVGSCSTPDSYADQAIASWTKRVAAATWATPRAGWEADARRTLRDDSAVVLTLTGVRSMRLYEGRKPWNHGRPTSEPWRGAPETTFYVDASCAEFPTHSHVRRFARYDADVQLARRTTDWPPRDPANLLGLETLEPIPAAYQPLVAN